MGLQDRLKVGAEHQQQQGNGSYQDGGELPTALAPVPAIRADVTGSGVPIRMPS